MAQPADSPTAPIQLNSWRQEATLARHTLALTPTEFRVPLCLAQGYDADELDAGELIKPHIHHLRQKLEPDPTAPRYILNVHRKRCGDPARTSSK